MISDIDPNLNLTFLNFECVALENKVYANVNIKTLIFLPVATANVYIIKL